LTDALKEVSDEVVHLKKRKITTGGNFGDHQQKSVLLEGVGCKAVAYTAICSVEV